MPAISAADGRGILLDAIASLIALEDEERVRQFCDLIRRGELDPSSSVSTTQDALALPQQRLPAFMAVLTAIEGSRSTPEETALAISAAQAGVEKLKASLPRIEIARTGPASRAFDLRSTGVVSRAIIESCRTTLLVVGYSVSVNRDRTGLAAETVDAIVAAAARGVRVTAVLHRDPKNRDALLHGWPGYARRPVLFTWPESPTDDMTKLHAKVLVGDRRDALVTSANLTYHGLEANIELGVHVTGESAGQIEAHFRDLIRQDELVVWPAD